MQKVFAQTSVKIDGSIFSPAKNFQKLDSLVGVITSNAFVIAGLIALVFILVGGFAIIMGAGSGDPKQMEQGRKTLTMAIIGFLVIIFFFLDSQITWTCIRYR